MGPKVEELAPVKEITCRSSIVGTYYRSPAEKSALYNSNKGDPVRLVRDPKNEFDANAVKVFVPHQHHIQPYHVGFLSKSDAGLYAKAMDLLKMKSVNAKILDPLTKYPTIQFEIPEWAVVQISDQLTAKDFE